MWLIVVALLVVVAVVIAMVATGRTGANPPLASTGAAPNASSTGGLPQPATPTCAEETRSAFAPDLYYELGADMVPSFAIINQQGTFICTGTSSQDGFTSVTTHYPPGADSVGRMLAYVQWLRDHGGFLAGPLTETPGAVSGVLWRLSLDVSLALRLTYRADETGSMVTVDKGPFDVVASGLVPATTTIAPALGTGPTLTLTPASQWQPYDTWQRHQDYVGQADEVLAYARVSEGALVGTVLVAVGGFITPPYPETLEFYAHVWTTDFHPQPPDIDLGPQTPTEVDGRPAVEYDFTWGDTQFRWVFIQEGGTVFTVMSVVSPSAVPDPADDVAAMLASIRIG